MYCGSTAGVHLYPLHDSLIAALVSHSLFCLPNWGSGSGAGASKKKGHNRHTYEFKPCGHAVYATAGLMIASTARPVPVRSTVPSQWSR